MDCYKSITETFDYLLNTSQQCPQFPSLPTQPGPPPLNTDTTSHLSSGEADRYVSKQHVHICIHMAALCRHYYESVSFDYFKLLFYKLPFNMDAFKRDILSSKLNTDPPPQTMCQPFSAYTILRSVISWINTFPLRTS